jgi:hypothetical protein
MIHGILQFTPSIAFCCVLHRCKSRDIRCRESFLHNKRASCVNLKVPQQKHYPSSMILGTFRAGSIACHARVHTTCMHADIVMREHMNSHTLVLNTRSQVIRKAGFDNDPSAGSPTETLLRLLLPLNDKVQWTSRDVAGSEPPASPRSEHFTGPFNR